MRPSFVHLMHLSQSFEPVEKHVYICSRMFSHLVLFVNAFMAIHHILALVYMYLYFNTTYYIMYLKVL